MKNIALAVSLLVTGLLPSASAADAAVALKRLAGYNVVAVMTITGLREKNGKTGDSFEGCDWERIIIFDDSKILKCAPGAATPYSYRPDAAVLSNGSEWEMIVGDEVFDMRR